MEDLTDCCEVIPTMVNLAESDIMYGLVVSYQLCFDTVGHRPDSCDRMSNLDTKFK